MNLTPDSFSDGGDLAVSSRFLERLYLWGQAELPVILDFGAESTAPTAHAINLDEEWARIELTLLSNPSLWQALTVISIDSYKVELVDRLIQWCSRHAPHVHLIWNDVSGKLDQEGLELLGANPELTYILCHNLAPTRELTQKHTEYLYTGAAFINHLNEWFDEQILTFQKHLTNPLWIDPCFGFSKTLEQNWKLFDGLSDFRKRFLEFPMVIGLSRKRFVRERYFEHNPEARELPREQLNNCLDEFVTPYYLKWYYEMQGPVIFRCHGPFSLNRRQGVL
jgi:dihydropteroate synthase